MDIKGTIKIVMSNGVLTFKNYTFEEYTKLKKTVFEYDWCTFDDVTINKHQIQYFKFIENKKSWF